MTAAPSSAGVLIVPGRDECVTDIAPHLWPGVISAGIDFDRRFSALAFGAQVAEVSELIAHAARDTCLVGRSFGAWLLLSALLDRPAPFVGTVLLLAPVLGYGSAGLGGFMAPRSRSFWREVSAGCPMPAGRVVLMVGEQDTLCPPKLACDLSRAWPLEMHGCPVGHALAEWTSVAMAARISAALHTSTTMGA